MAVLSITDQLTSLEVAKRSGFSQDSRRIIEELNAYNELLLDAPIVEANEGTVDSHLVRTAIPHGQLRGYNQGVGKGSSQTKTIKDVISNIEIYSTVDKQLIDESAHPKELMQSEQNAFIEGLSQDITDQLIYGNHENDVRETNGLAIRRKSTGTYCISMGGSNSGHLTSIYLIKWGMDKARIIYPRGAKNAGVEYNYLGEQTVSDGSGGEYQANRAHYRSARGLVMKHLSSAFVTLILLLQTSVTHLPKRLYRLCHCLHAAPEQSLLHVTVLLRDCLTLLQSTRAMYCFHAKIHGAMKYCRSAMHVSVNALLSCSQKQQYRNRL